MTANPLVWFGVAAVIALAIAAASSATAQGRTAAAAMDAIWRQPEAYGRIQTAMMLALAFMEALTLFVLVVAFGLPALLK
ncbi:MAG: ATP synthase F0 subunit C [Symbiobacteriia bacterium]